MPVSETVQEAGSKAHLNPPRPPKTDWDAPASKIDHRGVGLGRPDGLKLWAWADRELKAGQAAGAIEKMIGAGKNTLRKAIKRRNARGDSTRVGDPIHESQQKAGEVVKQAAHVASIKEPDEEPQAVVTEEAPPPAWHAELEESMSDRLSDVPSEALAAYIQMHGPDVAHQCVVWCAGWVAGKEAQQA